MISGATYGGSTDHINLEKIATEPFQHPYVHVGRHENFVRLYIRRKKKTFDSVLILSSGQARAYARMAVCDGDYLLREKETATRERFVLELVHRQEKGRRSAREEGEGVCLRGHCQGDGRREKEEEEEGNR